MTAPRPNVVFILADDLGWSDLGCFGNTEIETPVLDQLAADGLRATHAYAGSSWCSPTRISLYTGRYPGRLEAGLEEPLSTHSAQMGIPAGQPTLPSLLKDAGYSTAMFGKWHCGWLPWFSPLKIGFDKWFGSLGGAIDYFGHVDTLGLPDLYEDETPIEETGYYTELISDHVADHIRAAGEGPFYIQVNYTAPHWPWEGPDDAAVGEEVSDRLRNGEHLVPLFHFTGGSLEKYGEMVTAMDTGIGKVLDALDESGKRDNTLVVFCSDNGGERWSKNWPYIGEKGDLTEGGIRVPLIARWPDVITPGWVSEVVNITMDWTATILDAAGTEAGPSHPLDGDTLLPWLSAGGDRPQSRDLFWRVTSQGALRRGRFKYLRDLRPRPVLGQWPVHDGDYHLLYDVTVDGREAAEISTLHPEIRDELRTAWETQEADLLPYPADDPGLPRRASPGKPAISHPD
jgi:arylsulfatase A-like enzyme